MRNKFSSNLLQKGLISLAAASVLATSAMAVGLNTTEPIRVTYNNAIPANSATNIVVEVLDENGEVFTNLEENVEYYLSVNVGYNGVISADDGVTAATYIGAGTDYYTSEFQNVGTAATSREGVNTKGHIFEFDGTEDPTMATEFPNNKGGSSTGTATSIGVTNKSKVAIQDGKAAFSIYFTEEGVETVCLSLKSVRTTSEQFDPIYNDATKCDTKVTVTRAENDAAVIEISDATVLTTSGTDNYAQTNWGEANQTNGDLNTSGAKWFPFLSATSASNFGFTGYNNVNSAGSINITSLLDLNWGQAFSDGNASSEGNISVLAGDSFKVQFQSFSEPSSSNNYHGDQTKNQFSIPIIDFILIEDNQDGTIANTLSKGTTVRSDAIVYRVIGSASETPKIDLSAIPYNSTLLQNETRITKVDAKVEYGKSSLTVPAGFLNRAGIYEVKVFTDGVDGAAITNINTRLLVEVKAGPAGGFVTTMLQDDNTVTAINGKYEYLYETLKNSSSDTVGGALKVELSDKYNNLGATATDSSGNSQTVKFTVADSDFSFDGTADTKEIQAFPDTLFIKYDGTSIPTLTAPIDKTLTLSSSTFPDYNSDGSKNLNVKIYNSELRLFIQDSNMTAGVTQKAKDSGKGAVVYEVNASTPSMGSYVYAVAPDNNYSEYNNSSDTLLNVMNGTFAYNEGNASKVNSRSVFFDKDGNTTAVVEAYVSDANYTITDINIIGGQAGLYYLTQDTNDTGVSDGNVSLYRSNGVDSAILIDTNDTAGHSNIYKFYGLANDSTLDIEENITLTVTFNREINSTLEDFNVSTAYSSKVKLYVFPVKTDLDGTVKIDLYNEDNKTTGVLAGTKGKLLDSSTRTVTRTDGQVDVGFNVTTETYNLDKGITKHDSNKARQEFLEVKYTPYSTSSTAPQYKYSLVNQNIIVKPSETQDIKVVNSSGTLLANGGSVSLANVGTKYGVKVTTYYGDSYGNKVEFGTANADTMGIRVLGTFTPDINNTGWGANTGAATANGITEDYKAVGQNLLKTIHLGNSANTLVSDGEAVLDINYTSNVSDSIDFINNVGGTNFNLKIGTASSTATDTLKEIVISAGDGYLLTNGEIPVYVSLINESGESYKGTAENIKIDVTPTNLIKGGYIKNEKRSRTFKVGDSLDFNDTNPTDGKVTLSLQASNTVGDIAIKVYDFKTGVTKTETVKVIASNAEIVNTQVAKIETSLDSATIVGTAQSKDLTVTIKNAADEAMADRKVVVTSANTAVAIIDGLSELTTDSAGQVTLKIKSTGIGATSLNIASGGFSKTFVVKVSDGGLLTIGKSSSEVNAGSTDEIIVTPVAGSAITISANDGASDVATATYNSTTEKVMITGVSEGTEVFTLTDGTTSKTITVTVSGTSTSAASISSLGQSADATKLKIVTQNSAKNIVVNTDGTVTVDGKMKLTITDTIINVEAVKAGYSVVSVEVVDSIPTAREVTTETEYIQIADGKYLKVTLEKTVADMATTPAIVEGWNLLGNASGSSVDSSTLGAEIVWTYNGTTWTQDDMIANGAGFWYKATAAAEGLAFALGTETAKVADSFVAGTWSLLGCGGEKTIADVKAKAELTGSTTVWAFDNGTWSSDDTTIVKAGQGYWVK